MRIINHYACFGGLIKAALGRFDRGPRLPRLLPDNILIGLHFRCQRRARPVERQCPDS